MSLKFFFNEKDDEIFGKLLIFKDFKPNRLNWRRNKNKQIYDGSEQLFKRSKNSKDLVLDVHNRKLVAYATWFCWRTQEWLTKLKPTHYNKCFHVRQVRNLSLWRTYVRDLRYCRTPSPTLRFSDVFMVYRKGALGANGLKKKKTSTLFKKKISK